MRCAVCDRAEGVFEHVTYVGAPLGGVSVHGDCLREFFKRLDRPFFRRPEVAQLCEQWQRANEPM